MVNCFTDAQWLLLKRVRGSSSYCSYGCLAKWQLVHILMPDPTAQILALCADCLWS